MDQSIYPSDHSKGGLNFGNRNVPELDRLLEAQRAETNREKQREIWKQVWMQLDQVYDVFLPTTTVSRGFWHNYVLGYRPFPNALQCYGNSQLRSVWLDEGAHRTPEGRERETRRDAVRESCWSRPGCDVVRSGSRAGGARSQHRGARHDVCVSPRKSAQSRAGRRGEAL